MSKDDPLPRGWAVASLGQVGILHCGQSPQMAEVNSDGQGLPYYTGPEQWDGNRLRTDKWTTVPRRTVPEGCIFITVKGAGVGKLFPGSSGAIGRDIYAFQPSQRFSAKFIEHSLRFNVNQVLQHAKGDIPGLSKSHILDHVTAFPPRNEQDRIVAKIEELFSDLDAGVVALERAKANLKRYRAAVLKAAVEGRLTEQWRPDNPPKEPAPKLLDRILKERCKKWEEDQLAAYEAKGKQPPINWRDKYQEPAGPDTANLPALPEGWCWASLEALADVVGGITKDKKRETQPGVRDVPYLRVANVQRGFLDLSEIKTIAAPDSAIADLVLEEGDILFTEGGDRDKLGRGWVWSGELEECIHQNHIFRGRLFTRDIQPKFVSHHGNSFGKEWFIRAGKQTTNLASINMGILRRFPIPVPPASEQEEVVFRLDEKLTQMDAAEQAINNSLARATRLRQSILKRAFEGKLVPQDPTDESATILLSRMNSERQSSTENKRTKCPSGPNSNWSGGTQTHSSGD